MGLFDRLDVTGLLSESPMVGGLFNDSSKNALDQLQKNQALYNNIQLPNLQYQQYTPQDAQYQTVQDDPSLKSQQLQYLSNLENLSQNGQSSQDALGFQQARDLGNQQANAATQAAIQDAQSRGVAGSGMEFAMREMGNQAGAQRAQDAGLQQAANSAQQRALYNQAYGNALSGVRSQDYNTAANNANIINQFNAMNTQNRNQAQLYNQQNYNNIQQQNFNNAMNKANGQAGANTGMAQGYGAQDAARTSGQNANTQFLGSALGSASKMWGGM